MKPILVYHVFELIPEARDAVLSQAMRAELALCMALGPIVKQWPFLAAKLYLTGWPQKTDCELRSTWVSEITPGPGTFPRVVSKQRKHKEKEPSFLHCSDFKKRQPRAGNGK